VPSHDVNANGTFNVLRAAKEGQAGRVVYAASSSAYGDSDVLPKVESMPPRPKSPYALQKLIGEYYAGIFSGIYGLETVSLRYFNVYGPRQDPSSAYSGVLSIFMSSILDRKAPTIFGDGEHSRDFTFVEDVVELNLKAARAKGVSGNMYNAGNGGRITLNQAWTLLQQLEGITIPPAYGKPRAGDVRDSQADTTLAVRDLGHAPRFSFEEGMRITLEWYRTPPIRLFFAISAPPRETCFFLCLADFQRAHYSGNAGHRGHRLILDAERARRLLLAALQFDTLAVGAVDRHLGRVRNHENPDLAVREHVQSGQSSAFHILQRSLHRGQLGDSGVRFARRARRRTSGAAVAALRHLQRRLER
jgi:UDP-glucose 4-epimerase